MKNLLDIHCHSIASGHAYSSIEENARAASARGLELLAITDHGPAMPGGAHIYHFHNLRILPTRIEGVRILKGAEANIMNYDGSIDLDEECLAGLDFVIASLHPPCIAFGSERENTDAMIGAMRNPGIHVIGHPGDARYPFNIEEVVAASKETGTLLEINNSSLKPTSFRPGSDAILRKTAAVCLEKNVPLVMGSDAHFSADAGLFHEAEKLLAEAGFPEEMILNKSVEAFLKHIRIN
ncbi:MAG: phosphatase [Spirochaetales bacterium]|nr:phosphatase [Spirochaetales bacterium]